MQDIIKVSMLGGFAIEKDGSSVDDRSNRMKKVWLLLAYLIYSRNRHCTQENYISLLQGAGEDDSADPAGKLKAMFYRARTMLNQLDENAGHELIVRKNGTYAWNTDCETVLDAEEFEALCKSASAASGEEQLELYIKALELYKGDFLPKLNMEPWVMPLSAYYHRLYLEAADRTLGALISLDRWEDAAGICRKALKIEPYSENLYQHLMRCLIALDDRAEAITVYEDMCEILFSNFGVMPSDESRELYRLASRESGGSAVSTAIVREQLKEPSPAKGALFCEYDFFRLLYQVQARSIARSGDTIHIGLLSLHSAGKKDLSRRSLDTAMDNLQEIIITNLRQGDTVTKCSVSQFIIMLPQANYENSCMVCQRIIKAFFRKYPHSPADIHFSVQPLEPIENGR